MWRYRLLKVYPLVVGVVFFVLGVAGLSPSPPSPLYLSLPENLLHLGTGCIFFGGALLVDGPKQLRNFILGMGMLLIFGKVLIVLASWADKGFHPPVHTTVAEVICLVLGLGSLLVAAFAGSVASPTGED